MYSILFQVTNLLTFTATNHLFSILDSTTHPTPPCFYILVYNKEFLLGCVIITPAKHLSKTGVATDKTSSN